MKNMTTIHKDTEPPYEKRRRYAVQAILVFAASIPHFMMGMTLSWPNVVHSHISVDNSTLFGNQIYLHHWQMDMLNSLIGIGSIFGLFLAGCFVRKFGRKKSLITAILPALVGWAIIAMAYNAPMLLIGRFFDGVSTGMVTLAGLTYATEIPDTLIRGAIVIITGFMFLLGASFCLAIGIVLTWYHVGLGNVCAILLFIFFIAPFLPESPTFLVVTGQETKAKEILERLRGKYTNIKEEIELIKQMNDDVEGNKSWSFLLNRDIQKRILVLCMLFLIQGFTGTAVLRADAVRILESSGVTVNKDIFATLLLTIPLAGAILQWYLVDRVGRVNCLIISLVLMTVSYIVLGTNVYFQEHTIVSLVPLESNASIMSPSYTTYDCEDSSWNISLIGLIVCVFAMNIGIEYLPWHLSSEFFPTIIRSQAMSVGVTIGFLIAAVPLQLYTYMDAAFTTAGLFWTYGAVSALGVLFVKFCVPETAKKVVG